jgi:RNA polymerase sigma-70 factor, ECF subfamily
MPAGRPSETLEGVALAARDGDRAAFEELVLATSADLYALALRLVGNEQDASDVLQESYLRAYRAIGAFRAEASVRTWLYRITANCASSYLARSRRRRRESVLGDDLAPVEFRAEQLPEESLARRDERVLLGEAVGRLPATLRAVVVLHDVYELTHEAIAVELGISQAASKVRLHRARRRLRDELAQRSRAEERAGNGTSRTVRSRQFVPNRDTDRVAG